MLALLSYPLAVEPLLKLGTQAAILVGRFCPVRACVRDARPGAAKVPKRSTLAGGESGKPGLGFAALWAGLACCASVLLLAFTGHMNAQHRGHPLPLVLPLGALSLSFVLLLRSFGWYRRWLFLPLLGAGLAGSAHPLPLQSEHLDLDTAVFGHALRGVHVCHGELRALQTSSAASHRFLSDVAWAERRAACSSGWSRPNVFETSTSCRSACCAVRARDRRAAARSHEPASRTLGIPAGIMLLALTVALAVALYRTYAENSADIRVTSRNFYGVLTCAIRGEGPDAMRALSHGTIIQRQAVSRTGAPRLAHELTTG